jgi:hypothetical protein
MSKKNKVKYIGATADSEFLKQLISQKLDIIMLAKKKIRHARDFIANAKAELKNRGEDVGS